MSVLLSSCFFFFSSRRRHTRFKCDWSSDVCSSDLTSRTARIEYGITPFGHIARPLLALMACPPNQNSERVETSSSVYKVQQASRSDTSPLAHAPPVASRPHPACARSRARCVFRRLAVGSPRHSAHFAFELFQLGPLPVLSIGYSRWHS